MNMIIRNRNARFVLMLTRFARIRNCVMTFIGVMVGATLVYTGSEIVPINAAVITAALAATLITAGGNTLNDYFDVESDRINKPHRPIPSGRITSSDALMFSISLFLVGLALAKEVNKYAMALAVINTTLLVFYAKYSKSMLVFSNILISYLTASIFVYGALSVTDPWVAFKVDKTNIMLMLAACAFCITLAREVIKDVEDVEGDKKIYSRTIPISFGKNTAKKVAGLFTLAAIILGLLPLAVRHPAIDGLVYAPIIAVADLLFISALAMYAPLGQRTMIFGMGIALFAFFLGNITTRL